MTTFQDPVSSFICKLIVFKSIFLKIIEKGFVIKVEVLCIKRIGPRPNQCGLKLFDRDKQL